MVISVLLFVLIKLYSLKNRKSLRLALSIYVLPGARACGKIRATIIFQ
jgi:hypothetical protein